MDNTRRDAIADRAAWQVSKETAIKAAVELLTQVAVDDFAHQVSPRGLDALGAYREASYEVTMMTDAVQERVSDRLQKHYLQWRREARGE